MKMDFCGTFLLVVGLYLHVDVSHSDERVVQVCKGKSTAGNLRPHPSNCHLFVQCDGDRSYVKKCPKGLYFNPSIRVCDYKYNVKCAGNPCNKNNGGCQQKCVYINHNSYRCTCSSGYKLNYNQTACIQGSINMATYCNGKHGQQLPDPRNCDGFIKCSGDTSVGFSCGTLEYNDAIKVCDHRWKKSCKGRDFKPWSVWSPCFKAMSDGDCIQKRTRECTSGGTLCEGWTSEIRACKKEKCITVTPCALQNGGCMEKCTNEGGLAVCSCGNGLKLANDKKSCTSGSCGVAPLRDDPFAVFIISGQDVVKGSYPWQVAIYSLEQNEDGPEVMVFLCGGSLVDKRHVLSAAHCFPTKESREEVEYYTVVLGEHNRRSKEGTEQILNVTKIYAHENYGKYTGKNDIAILTLSDDAKFSKFIAPICLPKENEELIPGISCRITGWGNTYHGSGNPDILQEITVPVIEETDCKKRNNMKSVRKVTNDMICTGYNDGSTFKSACHGDSGGPLSCMLNGVWKLYGVVSWGDPQCNALESYNVFTKVTKYITWINKNKS